MDRKKKAFLKLFRNFFGLGLIPRNATLTRVTYSYRIFGLHGNPNPPIGFPIFQPVEFVIYWFPYLVLSTPSHSFLLIFINYSFAISYLPSVIYKLFFRFPLVWVRWKFWVEQFRTGDAVNFGPNQTWTR